MASKEELRAGDVVVYRHTTRGEPGRNGSLGIVLANVDFEGDHFIKWILPVGTPPASPYSHNLEVIGHMENWDG